MSTTVFTYGTLMFPAVMERVCGRRFECVEAELQGYMRTALRGRSYPGIILSQGLSCFGVLYMGVDDLSLERLDEFEGDEYDRASVKVFRRNQSIEATAYVLAPRARSLIQDEDWDPDYFETHHLGGYLARIPPA